MTISADRMTVLRSIADTISIDELMVVIGLIGLETGRTTIIERLHEKDWEVIAENTAPMLASFSADFMCDVINVEEVTNAITNHKLADNYVVDFNVVIK